MAKKNLNRIYAPDWVKKRRKIGVAKRMLARAMKKSGHTYREISEALDISVGALNYIIREEGPECGRLAHELSRRNAARHRLLAEHILSSISDSDIRKAPLKEKVIAAAILTDKAELIERSDKEQQGEHATQRLGDGQLSGEEAWMRGIAPPPPKRPLSEQEIEQDQRGNDHLFSRACGGTRPD